MRNKAIAMRMAIVGGLAAVIATTLIVLTAAAAGAACGCAAPAPRAGETEAVFQGTLTAVVDAASDRADSSRATPAELAYTFHVDRVLRGAVGSTIVVYAPMATSGCDSALMVGRRYEVRTRATATGLEVSDCTAGAAVDSDVLAIRRNGAGLTAVDGPDRFLVLGLAGLAVIAGLAVTALAVDHVRRVRSAPDSLPADGPGPGPGPSSDPAG